MRLTPAVFILGAEGVVLKEYIDKKGAIETVHVLPGSKLVPVVPADHKMQDQSNQLI